MIFAAIAVKIMEKPLQYTSILAFMGAALSALGLIHSYTWDFKNTPLSLSPAWTWSIAYLVMGIVLLACRWLTVLDESGSHYI